MTVTLTAPRNAARTPALVSATLGVLQESATPVESELHNVEVPAPIAADTPVEDTQQKEADDSGMPNMNNEELQKLFAMLFDQMRPKESLTVRHINLASCYDAMVNKLPELQEKLFQSSPVVSVIRQSLEVDENISDAAKAIEASISKGGDVCNENLAEQLNDLTLHFKNQIEASVKESCSASTEDLLRKDLECREVTRNIQLASISMEQLQGELIDVLRHLKDEDRAFLCKTIPSVNALNDRILEKEKEDNNGKKGRNFADMFGGADDEKDELDEGVDADESSLDADNEVDGVDAEANALTSEANALTSETDAVLSENDTVSGEDKEGVVDFSN